MATDNDDNVVQYQIWCDTKENIVHMTVTGFDNAEDAMAFADWLSELPLEETDIPVIH